MIRPLFTVASVEVKSDFVYRIALVSGAVVQAHESQLAKASSN
jgi:hypothetical protein